MAKVKSTVEKEAISTNEANDIAESKELNVVYLDEPIKRGDTVIEKVTLIKPNTGTLRGVTLADVANSDVNALIKVLPRMTYPALTEQEVVALDLSDSVQLASKVVGFLSPKQA